MVLEDYYSKKKEETEPKGILQSIASPFLRGATTVGRPIRSIERILGGEDPEKVKEEESKRIYDFGSLGKATPPIGAKEALGVGLQLGASVIPATSTMKGVSILGRVVQGGIAGTATGSTFGLGSGLQKDITGREVVKETLKGGISGLAAGATIGVLSGIGSEVSKKVKSVIKPDSTTAIVRAIKPSKSNYKFQSDVDMVLPEINKTAKLEGINISKSKTPIDDFQQSLIKTKKRIWNDYENILSPNKNLKIDGNTIADDIEASISKRFELQNRLAADRIRGIAKTYRRKITLGEAEDFLQEANNELFSYYAKNKVGQKVASQDPTISYAIKEAEGLRRELYSKLNSVTGKNATKLKRLYGALENVGKELDSRAIVVARQAPASLQETINVPFAAAKAAGSVIRGDLIGGGEALAQIGASKALKSLNSTQELIRRAFR